LMTTSKKFPLPNPLPQPGEGISKTEMSKDFELELLT
jgi:hypothetical protein